MSASTRDKPLLERFYATVLGLMVPIAGPRTGADLTFMSASPGNHHQLVLVSGRPDLSGFNPIMFMVNSVDDLRVVHNADGKVSAVTG